MAAGYPGAPTAGNPSTPDVAGRVAFGDGPPLRPGEPLPAAGRLLTKAATPITATTATIALVRTSFSVCRRATRRIRGMGSGQTGISRRGSFNAARMRSSRSLILTPSVPSPGYLDGGENVS